MKGCWMFQDDRPRDWKSPVFVLGGRFGDHIQMIPCLMEIWKRTGRKPVMVCSSEYASVYDGISYVKCHPVSAPWWQGIPLMYQVANELYGGGRILQWWNADPKLTGWVDNPGGIVLQCHGHNFAGVDVKDYPDYGTSMALRAGFERDEWISLPLVFDRRDYEREKHLVSLYRRGPKPMLLVNFAGHSSPFGPTPEFMRMLQKHRDFFDIVDLGKIKATRIYDLLGFMDRAVGMITIDTSTAHLAPASRLPYVALTVNGWCSSVPKGHCVLHVKYNEALKRLSEVERTVESWKAIHGTNNPRTGPVREYGRTAN